MARIRSRRPDAAAATSPDDQATAVVPAIGDGEQPAVVEQPTAVVEQPVVEDAPSDAATEPAANVPATETAETPVADEVPAGAELAPSGPSFRDRGRLRRRLRYLRRVRELGFRDLGGLVFDLDRFGKEKPELVRAKLDALGAIDTELRTLEAALGDERPVEELQEPGIASCAHCGTIHGSEARFCPNCGRPAGSAPAPDPAPAPEPVTEAAPTEPPAAE